jgi:ABC-2 type transport system permease protein
VTATTEAPIPAVRPTGPIRLTFSGILASEWIKFWSLRSTIWCSAILIFFTLVVGFLISLGSGSLDAGTLSHDAQQAAVANDATVMLRIGQLVLAVLAVLIITGEYGTGMIRSTLTVVPKRVPALLGKGLVLAIVAFLLGIVSTFGTAFVQAPLLARAGYHADFGSSKLDLALLGGAVYLTLIAVMCFGIGATLRSSAGGIAVSLGLLLVLPIVLEALGAILRQNWLFNIAAFTPSSAGALLFQYPDSSAQSSSGGIIVLTSAEGGLVLLAWAAVFVVLSAVLLKRRDA